MPRVSTPPLPGSPGPRPRRLENLTLKVNADSVLWARTRALFAGTTINALISRFIDEYAAVPQRWRDRLPYPWTDSQKAIEVFAEVTTPEALGERARLTDDTNVAAVIDHVEATS
jgi:hypothetical protein